MLNIKDILLSEFKLDINIEEAGLYSASFSINNSKLDFINTYNYLQQITKRLEYLTGNLVLLSYNRHSKLYTYFFNTAIVDKEGNLNLNINSKNMEVKMVKSRLDSQNYLVDLFNSGFGLIGLYWGVDVLIEPEALLQNIVDPNWEFLLGTALSSILIMGMKIVKSGQEFTWSYLTTLWKNSGNFRTKLIVFGVSVLGIALSFVNITLPEDLPIWLGQVVNSGFSLSIIIPTLLNIFNHYKQN